MWSFIKPINLIRYLVIWRVNRTLVRLPYCLATDISRVMGSVIANRLPTRTAAPWQKALEPWQEFQAKPDAEKKKSAIPEVAWPLESVIFTYPGKQHYGQDELILWELKLMGEEVTHGLFLETILPAMEEAGSTSDSQWYARHSLWGRFDIDSIYVARGAQWEPVVKAGRLDLSYRPDPGQWAEGLTFGAAAREVDRLTWLTHFDFTTTPGTAESTPPLLPRKGDTIPDEEIPDLLRLMDALIERLAILLPGKYNKPGDVWDIMEPQEQADLQEVIQQIYHIPVRHKDFSPVPSYWPGRWTGNQTFSTIPPAVIPYLDLAAILHLGKQTHFGCGTFRVM